MRPLKIPKEYKILTTKHIIFDYSVIINIVFFIQARIVAFIFVQIGMTKRFCVHIKISFFYL